MWKRLLEKWLPTRPKGLENLIPAFSLDYEVVVKFAFDPTNKQISFARNHDIAISQLQRGWPAREEIVTGTVEIRGSRVERVFNLLDYSLYSTATKIDQALKEELSSIIGRLVP